MSTTSRPERAACARPLALALATIVLAACADHSPVAPRPTMQRISGRGGEPPHVIVARSGVSPGLVASVQALGGQIDRVEDSVGVISVHGLSTAALASIAARSDVEAVQSDALVQWIPTPERMALAPAPAPAGQIDQSGAAFFPYQWNMRVTGASDAWLVSNEGSGTLVCILDTGTDPTHIDLAGRIDLSRSTSFVASEPFIEDLDFHGTFVSAIVSSNGIGVASVAPGAQLCAVKVLDHTGSGTFSDIIAGIVYATDAGANVINMSLGAYFSRRDPGAMALVHALQRAVNYANRHGVVVVAAAGNDATNLDNDPHDMIEVPAELAHVISVGATAPVDQQNFDRLASYSNYGHTGVDVFAPGGDQVAGSVFADLIFGPCSSFSESFDCSDHQEYLIGAGTSFSSPHVAGEAAVIDSDQPRGSSAGQVTACILSTATPLGGPAGSRTFGRGEINVLAAAHCSGGNGDAGGQESRGQ